jgi:TetR/AcrR family transcriptional regulator, transcriptional repressor for nem operon
METKQLILKQAFALFLSLSYKEVTIKRILDATGISKGAFYHHFGSKEELFTSVIEQFFFAAASDDNFLPSPDSGFIENMDLYIDNKEKAFAYFNEYLGIENKEINFFMFIAQAIRYLPEVKEKVILFMDSERQTLLRIMELAINNGELRSDLDINWIAELLMVAFDGTEMHGVLLGKSEQTIKKERIITRQIFELIKKQPFNPVKQ